LEQITAGVIGSCKEYTLFRGRRQRESSKQKQPTDKRQPTDEETLFIRGLPFIRRLARFLFLHPRFVRIEVGI
jgi:hypothetical protein